MAEALDAAERARAAQQRAALEGRHRHRDRAVQLEIPVPCEWFALCENRATHHKTHPILGSVPCCDRCAKIGE